MAVLCLAAAVLCADVSVVAARLRAPRPNGIVAASATRPVPVRPTTSTATRVPTAAVPAPPPTQPAITSTTGARTPTTPGRQRGGAWTLGPYEGLGAWVDIFGWTNEYTNGHPTVQVADIDRMADLGVQTLFIQTAADVAAAADVIEPERLGPMIAEAHVRGMDVVAWYLPTFEDVSVDLRRLAAAAQLPVDGLGVDIESLAVPDPGARNHRLLELSSALRKAMGTRAIAAITPSPVHLQVVNPAFWPGFPWPEIGATYDAILPMSYWSGRLPEWKSGGLYTGTDIDRVRASTGRSNMPIHVIGGTAEGVSPEDLAGMVQALQARQILGGSLYDWSTSQPAQWALLRPLRFG